MCKCHLVRILGLELSSLAPESVHFPLPPVFLLCILYTIVALTEMIFKLLIKQWPYLDILSKIFMLILNCKKCVASREEKKKTNPPRTLWSPSSVDLVEISTQFHLLYLDTLIAFKVTIRKYFWQYYFARTSFFFFFFLLYYEIGKNPKQIEQMKSRTSN